MQKTAKYIASHLYKPLLVKYLSVPRSYAHKGIRLIVAPEVFHSGFFFSTKILLAYIGKQPLQNRSFLELGAGSGLIALYAAKKGAKVTATDINPTAIEYLKKNRASNGIEMSIIHSDLFTHIPQQAFDIISVNPPYYRKAPVTDADRAWYCGENGEYFDGFFNGLENYTHDRSDVWMILCDGCDLAMINNIAAKHGWSLHCVLTKNNLIEKNFIFKIERTSPSIL